jgi:hypothetical protein
LPQLRYRQARHADRFQWPQVRWLHDNVYDDPDMAARFGLHGIPVFFVFRSERKMGRITAWPGPQAFIEAIETQITLSSLSET